MINRFIDTQNKTFFKSGVPHTIWFRDQGSVGMYNTFTLIAEVEGSCAISLPEDQDVFRLFVNESGELKDCLKTTYDYSNDFQTINNKNYVQIIFVCNAEVEGDYIESFYEEGTEYQIGCQIRGENEFYKINLINKGIELPESIKDALYQGDLEEERTDWIVLNNKYLELLQNYANIIMNKGSYKSLFNSLKWFNYGDLIELREVWQHQTEDGIKFGDFPVETIMSEDFKKALSVYTKTTYFTIRHNVEDFPYDDSYVLNKIQELEDEQLGVPADLYKVSLWGKEEMRCKLYLLGLYFEQYFMPIHLDLLRSCVEDSYYDFVIPITFANSPSSTIESYYEGLSAELNYDFISAVGGSFLPSYSYSQKLIKQIGDEKIESNIEGDQDNSVEGVEIEFSSNDLDVDPTTGEIYIDQNDSDSSITLGTITMKITLNGETIEVSYILTQDYWTYSFELELSYPMMSQKGGTISPIYSYTVRRSSGDYLQNLTENAEVKFSGIVVDENTGNVSAEENDTKDKIALGDVVMTVSVNGKSSDITVTVYQYAMLQANAVFYDSSTGSKLIIDRKEWNPETYDLDRYTPIGIMIVPPSHDVYNNSVGAMVSLGCMDYNNPCTGNTTEEVTMYYGYDGAVVNKTYEGVVIYAGNTYISPENVADSFDTEGESCVPSDNFSRYTSPDPKRFYGRAYMTASPSPYLEDDGRNPVYYQTTEPSSEENALAYFNGEGNTTAAQNMTTISWKNLDTIPNSHEEGNYPAACCCGKYYTLGTDQGDWYLPSIGELGYLMANLKAFNETIEVLNNYYENVGLQISNANLMSSTEYDEAHIYEMQTRYGMIFDHNPDEDETDPALTKTNLLQVRAFCYQSPNA